MIGAVNERRGEIHVYTSLGLAPLHVGFLFLSEAAGFAILGGVGGFILGQAFATTVTGMGWLSSITLNYGSVSAILSMTFVAIAVVASTIYPARMAAQLASPSEHRTWALPAPANDEIHTQLPFTINATLARGACAYLFEWFVQHRRH